MTWTLTEDDDNHDVINVRAVLSTVHQQDQLRNLIIALEKRLQLPRKSEFLLSDLPDDPKIIVES